MRAHLLRRDPKARPPDRLWERLELPDAGVGLPLPGAPQADRPAARLLPWGRGHAAGAVLVLVRAGAPISVNGWPPLPVALLGDRDEILVGGERVYLTTATPVTVEPFEPAVGSEPGQMRCALCGDDVAAGDRVVRCSACGSVHHEGALERPDGGERRCFSYDGEGRCAGCERSRADFEWEPGPDDEFDAPGGNSHAG